MNALKYRAYAYNIKCNPTTITYYDTKINTPVKVTLVSRPLLTPAA